MDSEAQVYKLLALVDKNLHIGLPMHYFLIQIGY